jgi:hypothetical protein
VVLRQGIDTTSPGSRLLFHLMASITEFERELIVEGMLDGLEARALVAVKVADRQTSPPATSAWHARCTTNSTTKASAATPSPTSPRHSR